jgi:hypothetical protein
MDVLTAQTFRPREETLDMADDLLESSEAGEDLGSGNG